MNKKELAKLLLKHPLIKKINESQMWDRSVVSRIIAEELLAEDEASKAEMKAAIELLDKEIEKLNKELEIYQEEVRKAIRRDDEEGVEYSEILSDEVRQRIAKKQKELETIKKEYDNLANAAAPTPPTKDDEVVTAGAKDDVEQIKDIDLDVLNPKKINPKVAPEQLADVVGDELSKITTDNVEKIKSALANASPEKETNQSQKDSKQLPSNGWMNPFESLRGQIAKKSKKYDDPQTFLDEVLDALSKQDSGAFFKLVAPTARDKDAKFQQALEVIKDAGAAQEFQRIIDSLKQNPEVAVDQAMSYLGFLQELSKLKDETERFGELVRGFTKQVAEKPEAPVEEAPVAKQFLQKMEKERGLATSDQLSGEDEAKRQEYIQIAESMISVVESLKNNPLLQNDLAKMFVGWWLMYNTDQTLQEGIVGNELDEFKSQNKLTNEETRELFKLFKANKQAFEKLMGDLESIINPQSEEEKVQTKQYLVPLANAKMPKVVLFKIAKGAGVEEETLKNLKISPQEESPEEAEPSMEEWDETKPTIENVKEAIASLTGYRAGDLEDRSELESDLRIYEWGLLRDLEELLNISLPDEIGGNGTLEELANLIDKTKEEAKGSFDDAPESPDEEPAEQSTDVTEEQAQEDAQEDVQSERQTPPQVYAEQHYKTIATFFADEDAEGLGFMQQLLLRRQSEQLYGLISALNELIDPTGGEERALNEDNGGSQEEAPTQQPTPELSSGQKRKLKSELIGLLSALKGLKTLSKAYEENLTRTSVDPRYDGSSLKSRLDAMLPEIQSSIARILKMISEFIAELPKTEPKNAEENLQEQEGEGLDRQGKIDLVADTYKEMRKSWNVLKPALKERLPKAQPEPEETEEQKPEEELNEREDASLATETVITAAKEIKELATGKPFITFFPTITFSQGGQVVSIDQANKVLSGVISQFVYVMRNVIALVKGEQITEGTANEVRDKLTAISQAIEKNFGVPAAKIVKQVEKQVASNPENQSLSDEVEFTASDEEWFRQGEGEDLETDADEEEVESGINLPDPSGELDKDDEDADASPFPVLGSGEDEIGADTEDETKNLEIEIDQLFKKVIGDDELKKLILFPFVNQLRELEGNKLKNVEMQKVALGLLILFIKAQDRELVSEVEWDTDVAKMKGHIESINKYLKTSNIKNKEVYTKILRMLYTNKSPQLLNLFLDRTNPAKPSSKRLRSKIKDIIDLKNIPSALRGSDLEEALKPIIAKMLKEHYG